MHHVKSNLTGGANPICGKGLRIHWKEKTASFPEQAVVIMFVVIGWEDLIWHYVSFYIVFNR